MFYSPSLSSPQPLAPHNQSPRNSPLVYVSPLSYLIIYLLLILMVVASLLSPTPSHYHQTLTLPHVTDCSPPSSGISSAIFLVTTVVFYPVIPFLPPFCPCPPPLLAFPLSSLTLSLVSPLKKRFLFYNLLMPLHYPILRNFITQFHILFCLLIPYGNLFKNYMSYLS